MEFKFLQPRELPLHWHSELIGVAESKTPNSVRWSELAIYRLDDGQYAVQTINRTTRPSEQDQFATILCDDVPDLLRALVRQNMRFAALARLALHGAAQNDKTIAESERRRMRRL